MNYLENKRNNLLQKIQVINSNKTDMPKYITSLKSPIVSLEKDLCGKQFNELTKQQQRTIYGDMLTFNPVAFHYYIFDVLEDSLLVEEFPSLFSMFLMSLTKESVYFDNRVTLFSTEEKKLICEYMEYLTDFLHSSNRVEVIILREDYSQEVEEILRFWCEFT